MTHDAGLDGLADPGPGRTGGGTAPGPVCLFAHYAPDRPLSASVLHYLRALVDCGLRVHVALSGMESLGADDSETLRAIGVRAYPRANAGLDFGAWQHLMQLGCADNASCIVLANDSVFGPVQRLSPLFERMQARGRQVWGLVESREVSWHLQSWFLCLDAQAWHRPAIRRVFEQDFAAMSKAEIILHGEIALGTAIQVERLSWTVAFRDERRGLRRLVPTNAMHLDWCSTLRSGDVPFLKVELLRDNPARVPWAWRWRRMLARHGSFPAAWIEQRIAPVGKARPTAGLRLRLLYVLLSRDRREALLALLPTPVPRQPRRPAPRAARSPARRIRQAGRHTD